VFFKKINKNSIYSFLSQVFVVFQSFLLLLIVTRYVDTFDFGVYTLCLTAVTFLTGFFLQPLIQSYMVYAQDDTSIINSVNQHIKSSIFLSIIFGCSCIFLGFLLNENILLFGLIILLFIFEALRGYILAYLNIIKDFKKMAVVSFFLIFRPILILIFYIFNESTLSMMYASILSLVINLFLSCRSELNMIFRSQFDSSVNLKPFYQYSINIFPSKIMYWCYYNFDKITISFFFGPSILGLYAPIFNFIYQIYFLIHMSLTNFFRPYIYEDFKVNKLFFIKRYSWITILSFLIILLFTTNSFFIEFLKVFLGKEYHVLLNIIPSISLLCALMTFTFAFEMIYLPTKKINLLWKMQLVIFLLFVPIILIFFKNLNVDQLIHYFIFWNMILILFLLIGSLKTIKNYFIMKI